MGLAKNLLFFNGFLLEKVDLSRYFYSSIFVAA
jgi:hypothetical protein